MKTIIEIQPESTKLFRVRLPADKFLEYKGEVVQNCDKYVYIASKGIEYIEDLFKSDLQDVHLVAFNHYTVKELTETPKISEDVIIVKASSIANSRFSNPLEKQQTIKNTKKENLFKK